MEKKNVLITGVTGTVARQLAEKLMYDKRVGRIMGVGRDDKPYYFKDFDPHRFVFKKVNILRPRQLTNLFLSEDFKEMQINTVVHMAFINTARGRGGEETHELNVEGTKNLLDMCIENEKIRKFIFRSSVDVYRIRHDNPVLITESADLNLESNVHPVVRDKVDADMLCRTKMDNPRMKIVVLRPTGVIGRNVRSYFNYYFEGRVAVKPAGYDPMINLMHANDMIAALRAAIHRAVKGIFNVGGKTTAPLSEYLRLAHCRVVPVPLPLLLTAGKTVLASGLTRFDPSYYPDRLLYSCLLDTTRAREALGFEPSYHIKFD